MLTDTLFQLLTAQPSHEPSTTITTAAAAAAAATTTTTTTTTQICIVPSRQANQKRCMQIVFNDMPLI